MSSHKRQRGQYFTKENPFNHPAFKAWAKTAGLPQSDLLEPFAGANSLISMLSEMGLCRTSTSYDISPANKQVKRKDTLKCFPKGYSVCVTNPPWLAKNSATIRGLRFPDCTYDDIYKFALKRCLDNCAYVAALVPESFITANLFQERLKSFVSLTSGLFEDTQHPVGLAMFKPECSKDVVVWSGNKKVGMLSCLKSIKPNPKEHGINIKFNQPEGNVGLIALDNTLEPSIRFCDVSELKNYKVKPTGRHITKLKVQGEIRISDWNQVLNEVRKKTYDVLMTCYKGIRRDGMYRRRCDWSFARGIIQHVG